MINTQTNVVSATNESIQSPHLNVQINQQADAERVSPTATISNSVSIDSKLNFQSDHNDQALLPAPINTIREKASGKINRKSSSKLAPHNAKPYGVRLRTFRGRGRVRNLSGPIENISSINLDKLSQIQKRMKSRSITISNKKLIALLKTDGINIRDYGTVLTSCNKRAGEYIKHNKIRDLNCPEVQDAFQFRMNTEQGRRRSIEFAKLMSEYYAASVRIQVQKQNKLLDADTKYNRKKRQKVSEQPLRNQSEEQEIESAVSDDASSGDRNGNLDLESAETIDAISPLDVDDNTTISDIAETYELLKSYSINLTYSEFMHMGKYSGLTPSQYLFALNECIEDAKAFALWKISLNGFPEAGTPSVSQVRLNRSSYTGFFAEYEAKIFSLVAKWIKLNSIEQAAIETANSSMLNSIQPLQTDHPMMEDPHVLPEEFSDCVTMNVEEMLPLSLHPEPYVSPILFSSYAMIDPNSNVMACPHHRSDSDDEHNYFRHSNNRILGPKQR